MSIFLLQAGYSAPASANSKYAAIVVHADSGDVLFDRSSNELRYPASLTKMMTLYLLFEEMDAGRLSPTSNLTVSAQAAAQPPSKLGLVAGTTIDLETAIKALSVKSANDAAVVIAEAISGTEWRFAQKMTDKARALGMRKTTFRNASGLPNSKQLTTARDLALLSRKLMQDYPHYYAYLGARSFTWNGRTYETHNALVRNYAGADGLKTGYTRISGFNLATSAKRNDARLVGIVLGGRSVRTRDAHMREILDGAFAALKANPALVASLHRSAPTPRIKPTLLAQLERERAVPTVAGNAEIRQEILTAATSLTMTPDFDYDDTIALLAATALQGDFNEQERARLAANDLNLEGLIGEGDSETAAAGWSVQIGAYSTKEMAQAELEKATQIATLSDRARIVQPMPGADGSAVYRARFTSLSAYEADMICATLQAKKRTCFVIAAIAAAPTAP